MIVRSMMNKNAITTTQDSKVIDVQKQLKENKIHRMPVLDKKGKLIGIITEKSILYASPSPASSLSMYEIPALFAKLKVKDLMSKPRFIHPDTTVEDAAKIMVEDDLSCLPVVDDDNNLVGIVSKSDMFKVLYELFGASEKGVRITFKLNESKGQIARLSTALLEKGYDIISMGTFVDKNTPNSVLSTLKVRGEDKNELLEIVKPLVKEVLDIRIC